jgi:DNA gyrase subunit B
MLANSAAAFQNPMCDGANVLRSEGDKMKDGAIRDFQQAMEWLR